MLIRTTSPIEDSEAASTLMSMFTPGGTQKTGVRAKNGQFSFPFSSEKQGKFELDTAAEGGFYYLLCIHSWFFFVYSVYYIWVL